MKKNLFLVAVAMLICSFAGQAQLLWKITGKNLKKPSYVFGTYHIAPGTMCDSIKGLNEALAGSDVVYGEVVMDDMAAMQQQMIKYLMAPQDSALTAIYSPQDLAVVDTLIKNTLGASVQQVAMLKPAALSTQISLMLGLKKFPNFDPNTQLDATVQKRAKEQNKAIKGLETVDFQINMLFCSPIQKQANDLLELAKNTDCAMEMLEILHNAYMSQDLDKLLSLTESTKCGGDPADVETLIYGRNIDWAKYLKTALPADGSAFIAVGAAHLPGKKGIIELLRKDGFKVTPVK